MDYYQLEAVSSAVMAFATVLGVMFAIIYYMFVMASISILEAVLGGIIYIDSILIFLYIIWSY